MVNKETERKIQELQILEQNSQQFLMQKQTFQVELSEVENALGELKTSTGDTYKILGGIMIKTDRTKLTQDLEERKKLLSLRISSVEKQEKLIDDRLSSLREEVKSELQTEK